MFYNFSILNKTMSFFLLNQITAGVVEVKWRKLSGCVLYTCGEGYLLGNKRSGRAMKLQLVKLLETQRLCSSSLRSPTRVAVCESY